ncbi:MAG: GAF domain-containing protein [Anaerolineae bacterium]|nr:GAF domain-containing protein [Anaerolineae bacterium]
MSQLWDLLLTFLAQFAGGPGAQENNLVRFALPALFWGVLLVVAWSRQRHEDLPREKLLVWGFGLALFRESLMFAVLSIQILNPSAHDVLCRVVEPVEHALTLASVVVIAGSYLRFILDDALLARRYLQVGLGAAALGFLATVLWWPRQLAADPGIRFHQAWSAWLLHSLASGLIATAIVILVRKQGWLRNVVLLALSFLFLGEFLILLNYVTDRASSYVLCPLGNSFHIWAVPLFGYVYFREQSIDKKRADEALKSYRDHLEELVASRTAELTSANEQLQWEIGERLQAEAEISQRNAELAAQNAIAATISQSLDQDMILSAALDRTLAVLEMEAGCIFLVDPDSETLTLQVYQGQASSREWVEDERQECLCQDVSYRAVTGLEPVVTKAADDTDRCQHFLAAEDGLQVLVSTPLVSQNRAVGALTLGAQHADAVSPQEMELLTAIGQQIGMAVENAHLYRETERWAEGMALLHESSVLLSSTLDPGEIYDQITHQSAGLIDCPVATLFGWDEARQEAIGVSSYGLDGHGVEGMRLQLGESSILSQLIARRRPIAVEDARQDPRIPPSWRERFAPQALLCLPVWGTAKPLGFLFVIDPHKPRRWRPDKVDLLESFTDRAAVALENARLHKQLEWAAALEERQRIAAEMHDGLAQTLSYLGHRTDQASELLGAGRFQQVGDEFQRMQDAIGRAARDIRRAIASLQESPRPRQSLQDALRQVVAEVAEGNEPSVTTLTRLPAPLFLPPGELEQVVRVVQEALLNALRHAQARQITVRLERLEDALEVVVEDDGQGFDPSVAATDSDDHFGLSIMQARAARIGGAVAVDTLLGRGTRVVLTWPLDIEQESAERKMGGHTLEQEALTSTPAQPRERAP